MYYRLTVRVSVCHTAGSRLEIKNGVVLFTLVVVCLLHLNMLLDFRQ